MNSRIQSGALFTILAFAVAGIVLCFPWQLDGQGSCLLQRWIQPARALTPSEYVLPYGLLWWGSWALLFFGVSALRRARRKAHRTGG